MQTQRFHGAAYFAVFALAQRYSNPRIIAFLTLQLSLDGAGFNAVYFDAVFQAVQIMLGDMAIGTDAIFALPRRAGQFKLTGELSVIGEQEQAFGGNVQSPDRNHAAQLFGQCIKDGLAALFIFVRCDQAIRFVIAPETGRLFRGNRLIVEKDDVFGRAL